MPTRRSILKTGAGALAAASFAEIIAEALAVPARAATGSIGDVEHVVILMQENRSFDHYFGSLRGVRGYSDPRPISLPDGAPVWRQPDGRGGFVAPFRLDARRTSAESIGSLDHSWKGAHARWKNYDGWIPAKTPMTMGYFTREDLPFYYALADAFTICDGYHCSIFGPTIPNRLYLFTGTNGLTVGREGPLCVRNPYTELNFSADPAHDSALFRSFSWTTYAERLEAAGVSWKVYQEYDNYGDNALAYFRKFRGAHADAGLMARGRGCSPGSNAANAKASRGEHMVAAFADDVREGRLPSVSWLVAPYIMCEHPKAGPSYGQSLVARLLAALVSAPETWAKTVFLINYDENDGFFDHAPPYLPATGPALGASSVDLTGESYRGEPVGLGPRVPMLIVSPWSKGGWVNSQVFDHTSVLQFLERRFGVAEPNISAWRRCVCGDLTSAFDFAAPDGASPALPDTGGYIGAADATEALPSPVIPGAFAAPLQETGQRPSRSLPYELYVSCQAKDRAVKLDFRNAGAAGAAFNVYARGGSAGPWFYTVEAGKSLSHTPLTNVDAYDLCVYGPNGFLREFRGLVAPEGVNLAIIAGFEPESDAIRLLLRNEGEKAITLRVRQRAYGDFVQEFHLDPGQPDIEFMPFTSFGRWYDIELTCAEEETFAIRFAGHWETGEHGLSDPLIGRA